MEWVEVGANFSAISSFQIVAREKNVNNIASAPLSVAVVLNDLNDNAPRLPSIPPISLQAGENRRQITKVCNFDEKRLSLYQQRIHV